MAPADTVVWLDLPRPTVMRQIAVRSLRRVVTREELWNGNRETWRNLLTWDPNESVMRWAWTHFDTVRQRYEAAMDDPRWAAVDFIRLRSRREAAEIIEAIRSG